MCFDAKLVELDLVAPPGLGGVVRDEEKALS